MTQAFSDPQNPAVSRPSGALSGRIAAPGDKSISHRALILGALAKGRTEITGLLESEDVLATARAVGRLGALNERLGPGHWRVEGRAGRFASPAGPLDLGNSGTGVRLLLGAAAGAGANAVFTGDSSLSARPMARVTDPLQMMGAAIMTEKGRLPARLTARPLRGMDYTPPIASAQVKSAILLAALGARGQTVVKEPCATRDHTETMLPAFGGAIETERRNGGIIARMPGEQTLRGAKFDVAGDPSSAAFATVAALITPGSAIEIEGVMTNPARFGLYETLLEMGAGLSIEPADKRGAEAAATLKIRASRLRAVTVPAERAPSMIDEYPILAVAAAFAAGESRMEGLAELRAKESDRLEGTLALLTANGVQARAEGDTLIVQGCDGEVPGGGLVEAFDDHRLAMSALVLGAAAEKEVRVDDARMIATSYPDFFEDMQALGADIRQLDQLELGA